MALSTEADDMVAAEKLSNRLDSPDVPEIARQWINGKGENLIHIFAKRGKLQCIRYLLIDFRMLFDTFLGVMRLFFLGGFDQKCLSRLRPKNRNGLFTICFCRLSVLVKKAGLNVNQKRGMLVTLVTSWCTLFCFFANTPI